MNVHLLLLPITAFLLVSCGRASLPGDYIAIHKDGVQKLEASRLMNAHYAEVDNFIVHFGFGRQPLEWQTVAFIEGRFELTHTQPVTVDYSKRTVTPAGDPRFTLNAAESVTILPGSRTETRYDGSLRRVFNKAEWDRFVLSGYDLTSLGIPKDEIHSIPRWSEHVRAWRKDRLPIK